MQLKLTIDEYNKFATDAIKELFNDNTRPENLDVVFADENGKELLSTKCPQEVIIELK